MSPSVMKKERKTDAESSELDDKKRPKNNVHNKEKPAMKFQPTPDQLRIASLIRVDKEDPLIKEKLKRIIEATQRSADEAYIALHDSDFDTNRAVNMLLEGAAHDWCMKSKKKKTKPAGGGRTQDEEVEEVMDSTSKEEVEQEQLASGKPGHVFRGGHQRGRGRGRGNFMGRRGSNNTQPHDPNFGRRKVFINSAYDVTSPEPVENVLQERMKNTTIRPLDTWDPCRPVSNLISKGRRHEFDEEEYTGSLAKGLVITSSNFGGQHGKASSYDISEINGNSEHACHNVKNDDSSNDFKVNLKIEEKVDTNFSDEKDYVVPTKSETNVLGDHDLQKLESPTVPSLPKPSLGTKAPPITASVTKAPPIADKVPLGRPMPPPAIPAPPRPSKTSVTLKKPTVAVVMPPDTDEALEALGITFGSTSLSEDELDDKLHDTSSISEILSCETKSTVQPDFTGLKEKSSVEKLRFNSDMKLENNRICDSPVRKNSFSKTTLKSHSLRNSPLPPMNSPLPIINSPMLPINSTCAVYPPNASVSYAPSPNSAGSVSMTFPQLPFTTYNAPQSSTPYTTPPPPYCQNVLGNQTYTSNSHYGSSILSNTSYPPPYSYSSMVQGHTKNSPATTTYTKELEGVGYSNVATMSYPGVSSSPMSVPMANLESFGKSPPHDLSKGNALPNMHPMVGPHQFIVGQGGLTYYQQPPLYFQDVQSMQKQMMNPQVNQNYYDVNFPGSPPPRDMSAYQVNDKVYIRADGSFITSSAHPPSTASTEQGRAMAYSESRI